MDHLRTDPSKINPKRARKDITVPVTVFELSWTGLLNKKVLTNAINANMGIAKKRSVVDIKKTRPKI